MFSRGFEHNKTRWFFSTIWHQRLGHPNSKLLNLLKDKGFLNVARWTSKYSICVSCQLGKSCKLLFNSLNKTSKFSLEKIHCDLWGPAPIISNQRFRFYVIFIDDYSRFTWLYPLKRKSEFFDCFRKFQKFVENQFDRKIKIFQCDEGGEFNSTFFLEHIKKCGIDLHVSCPGTPGQNSVAERKHQHIVEMGLTKIFHANMPLSLWVDVFLTTVYLINRLPSSILNNESPYYKLYNRHPDYRGLRVLGCQCFPSLRHQGSSKFDKKTYPCVFIGYSSIHKGFRCLEPKTKRVYISRHMVFDESVFPFKIKRKINDSPLLTISEFPSNDEWISPAQDDRPTNEGVSSSDDILQKKHLGSMIDEQSNKFSCCHFDSFSGDNTHHFEQIPESL